MRVLVTGGAGFIGSNFVHHLLGDPGREIQVLNVDNLTYAGNLENLGELKDDSRYRFFRADISDADAVGSIFDENRPDVVVHFAAESHVDRSIEDASPFIRTNVQGTQVLLDASLKHGVSRFVHVSTDEVYGFLDENDPGFKEDHPLDPSSPYSASKAASDLLAMAYHRTYGLPVMITRCSNNYGPFQFPEKLIPLMLQNALADEPLPVYGDGRNIRDWIHVEDHCRAIEAVMEKGTEGRVYNIGGEAERRNLEIVKAILKALDKPESLIRFVKDRPGHDWRYAMDISLIRSELGWEPRISFEDGLKSTIQWYLEHRDWVDHVISGKYREYYSRMYGERLEETS